MSFVSVIRKRVIFLVLVVFGVSLITFAISHMIPGDPARLVAGDRASDEIVTSIRQQMGLDRPLPEQYWRYLTGILRGDLGISTPAFWLGLILIVTFYGVLGVLPGGGRIDPNLPIPRRVTGFYLIDSLVAGDPAAFGSTIRHLILPAFCLGFIHLGVVARQIRSAMLDELQQDYVRTARANGIAKWRVIFGHTLPNALIPSVTVLGLALGDLLYGAVLTETVFAWPGMGAYVVNSIQSLDFPAVMGFSVVVSFAYVLVNLAVDLIYMTIDPRITGIH